MHEVSLGGTLRDYLTGEEIEETTYEEFRQALARLMVEEKGYPRDKIRVKVDLPYTVDGEDHERPMDFVVDDENGKPIFIVMFCAGEIGTYEREAVMAARLFPGGPVPFILVTDSMSASLMDAKTGDAVAYSMSALPDWETLTQMVADNPMEPYSDDAREKMIRIFHAYCGFVQGRCCNESNCGPV